MLLIRWAVYTGNEKSANLLVHAWVHSVFPKKSITDLRNASFLPPIVTGTFKKMLALYKYVWISQILWGNILMAVYIYEW